MLAACGAETPPIEQVTDPAAAIPTAPTPTARETHLVEVRDGEVVAGFRHIAVNLGEAVELTVTSDQEDVVVIEGYDIRVQLGADRAAAVQFRATELGTFEIMLERTGLKIGDLTVTE